VPGLQPATAAHAQIGTPVANVEMGTLRGGKARLLGDANATVLVFFRPNQERSLAGLKELAECQKGFAGKPVHWVAIVSDSVPADRASAVIRDTGISAPVLVDAGDALYGSLGVVLHPVVVIVGRDHKLAAFEPFNSVRYCAIVSARIQRVLGEISEEELQQVLASPRAAEGSDAHGARRYRALAEALFKAKNYEKALENARRSLERDNTLAPTHALLGDILAAQGNCADAAAAYRRALAIDGANGAAKEGIGRCGK
jgi:tetratricopeptide (TPR) repeat protein